MKSEFDRASTSEASIGLRAGDEDRLYVSVSVSTDAGDRTALLAAERRDFRPD